MRKGEKPRESTTTTRTTTSTRRRERIPSLGAILARFLGLLFLPSQL